MRKVKEMLLFANGNIACFDENLEQITELQSRTAIDLWADWASRAGYDVTGCLVRTQVSGGPGKEYRIHGSAGDSLVKPA